MNLNRKAIEAGPGTVYDIADRHDNVKAESPVRLVGIGVSRGKAGIRAGLKADGLPTRSYNKRLGAYVCLDR
jgi:hypothetical protein